VKGLLTDWSERRLLLSLFIVVCLAKKQQIPIYGEINFFNESKLMSVLYKTNTLSLMLIVLAH
jgi:hypothetical protein